MADMLKIYNSRTREKVPFKPINPPFVGLYVCGPTVYNEVHLGNLRTFLGFDIVYRYLTFLGYKVRYVRNITDAGHLESDADAGEDKISKQARLEQIEPMEIVQRYTTSFHRVTDLFNMHPPSIEPTATGHIVEQIEMIEKILSNGFAYVVNGSVYFDVLKFMENHEYGQLSGRKVDELLEGSRELDGQQEKKNTFDFALWKKASDAHIMRWTSPWGVGFPGWHLECSVMSTKYLGNRFDIHGGGMDLKFPHHECEIAQNVGSEGIEPVNYWMHANMLTMNGQKMSKSTGNSFTPAELIAGNHELLEKGYDPMVIRFFMLQSHYRSTLDFSNSALQAAEKGFARLMNAYNILNELQFREDKSEQSQHEIDQTNQICRQCSEHMNDDFNTAETIARLFDLSKKINSYKEGILKITSLDSATFENLKSTFNDFILNVLGLKPSADDSKEVVDGLMNLILEIRQEAREKKDYALSDQIRDHLTKLNIKVKDGKEEVSWSVQV